MGEKKVIRQSKGGTNTDDLPSPRPFWIGSLAFAGLAIVALVIFCFVLMGNKGESPWYLLLLATASVAAGALCGFLYSTFGSESERFGDVFKVINGGIAGFAIGDLTKPEASWIVKALQSLARPAGPGTGAGVVITVVLTFGSIGFILLYFAKRLLLNRLSLALGPPLSAEVDKASAILNAATPPILLPREVASNPPVQALKDAAEVVLQSTDAGAAANLADLKARAKASYISDDWEQAEDALRRAYRLDPKDPETLLYLANVIINDDRPIEAIRYLEELATLQAAPTVTWKLLGYAYLWRPDKLEDAARASERYLAAIPDDAGALLNLACALAQRGPTNNPRRDEVVEKVRLLSSDPEMAARIRDLTAPGLDFELWVHEKDFRAAARMPPEVAP
jgi:tetratricopeptide (TPR) repeat protein